MGEQYSQPDWGEMSVYVGNDISNIFGKANGRPHS